MTTAEQKKFVEGNYSEELKEVQNALDIAEYRDIERVIDMVENLIFSRYCVTLLVDELISLETTDFSEDEADD